MYASSEGFGDKYQNHVYWTAHMPLINTNDDIFSDAIGLKFGLSFQLYLYFKSCMRAAISYDGPLGICHRELLGHWVWCMSV